MWHDVLMGLLWLYFGVMVLLLGSILFTIAGMLIWKD